MTAMQHYVLDGARMTTLESAYDELEQVFDFPSYFGRNLDALEDCLADLANEEGALGVVIKNSRTVERALPEWESLLEVFLENPHISLNQE